MDLQPFFNTLVLSSQYHGDSVVNTAATAAPSSASSRFKSSSLALIEQVIEKDFLEPLPG